MAADPSQGRASDLTDQDGHLTVPASSRHAGRRLTQLSHGGGGLPPGSGSVPASARLRCFRPAKTWRSHMARQR
jgi:hypothetical protein